MTGTRAMSPAQRESRPHSGLANPKKSLTMRVFDTLQGIVAVNKKESKADFGKGLKKNPLYTSDGDDVILATEPESKKDPRKQYRRKGDKVRGQSTPALVADAPRSRSRPDIGARSSSQPTLVPFHSKYVDKLKAQPFTLKEKLSQWCKKSPMALIKAHEPPQDHYIACPSPVYEDIMCDEYGRNLNTMELDQLDGPTTKPRVESVLNRYAPRHGINSTFDNVPKTEYSRSAPAVPTNQFSNAVNARSSNTPPSPEEDELAPLPSPLPARRRGSGAPMIPKRMPTNISLIPQTSRINEDMLADLKLR